MKLARKSTLALVAGELAVVVAYVQIARVVAQGLPEPARRTVGPYRVTLRLPEGGLFAGEEMQIEFRIEAKTVDSSDAAFTPVRYARIQCSIDMPSMPGMPRFSEQAHAEGVAGEYGVHPTFPHGGDYLLHIRLLPPNEQLPTMSPPPTSGFAVEFPLAVLDPRPPGAMRASGTQRFVVSLDSDPTPPRAGRPTALRIQVRRNVERPEMLPEGGFRIVREAVPVTDFDVAHERLLHLFLLRDDLGTFAHEHPVLGGGGTFAQRFTFPTGGNYVLFADAAPRAAGSQVLSTRVAVAGPSTARFDLAAAARGDRGLRQTRGGVTVTWTLPSDPMPIRRTVRVTGRLTDAYGKAVHDLEPYLGAAGHLMIVREGGAAFVHAHPDETRGDPVEGEVPFLVRLPEAGFYRGWAQFQRAGEVLTFDFVVLAAGAG